MEDKAYLIEKATVSELPAVAELAARMWDHPTAELEAEFAELLADPEAALFTAKQGGEIIAFAQCQLRHDYVEGTDSSPVGYLEGVFVSEGYRRKGFAAELLAECEKWAKEKGCVEFASDCELDNLDSLRFHMAMGFTETNRIICFKKELQDRIDEREV